MVGLVSNHESNINSIEEIIKSEEKLILVASTERDHIYFKTEIAKIDDQELRYKFNKILGKMQVFHANGYLEIIDKPELVKEFTVRSIFLDDEYSINWIIVSFSFENR